MKRITLGLLAHVDSGKTTLSEALLYNGGAIRKMGRVDHRDSTLDTEELEKSRGITIFSKQAFIVTDDLELYLLDTPGHTDLGPEAERTISVLDYAVLIISAPEGVQNHTITLWKLLEEYRIPTFIFVNKTDLFNSGTERIMDNIKKSLSDRCVDFSDGWDAAMDEASLLDEDILERFLSGNGVSDETVASAVKGRSLVPVYFGSALRNEGVDRLFDSICRFTLNPQASDDFSARVYKIKNDGKDRLTFLKVIGGELSVKDRIEYTDKNGKHEDEKVDSIRIYTGSRYESVRTAPAGTVCAVTGLSGTFRGQGLGSLEDNTDTVLQSIFTYKVIYPDGNDPSVILSRLRKMEEEEPQLKVSWNRTTSSIYVDLTGTIQLEILASLFMERYGIPISFDSGSVIYLETLKSMVEGVGHYEPLRHYAEVHILIEPMPRGSGIEYATLVSEDDLDRNWQRLILTHLAEKEHLGVLTGSPLTDVKYTLVRGRAHKKHTEGGDFRQATYRAVRNGLMQAENILLEPWYDYEILVPNNSVGRVISDIQRMGGNIEPPVRHEEMSLVTGSVPASEIRGYGDDIAGFTHGTGRISLSFSGYRECHDPDEVIRRFAYDAESDTDNSPDSVFCAHGAGFIVKWNDVKRRMHLEPFLKERKRYRDDRYTRKSYREIRSFRSLEDDKELLSIFESTYGKLKTDRYLALRTVKDDMTDEGTVDGEIYDSEYLIVDGYNVIFAWDFLRDMAKENLEDARKILCDLMCNYKAFRQIEVIIVFDAYRVRGNPGSFEMYNNIHIVYTKEAETADTYIEKVTRKIAGKRKVRVATSDALEQTIILGHGALRLPALALLDEVIEVERSISEIIEG